VRDPAKTALVPIVTTGAGVVVPSALMMIALPNESSAGDAFSGVAGAPGETLSVVVDADGCVVDVEVDDDVGELVEVVELGTDEDDVLDDEGTEVEDGGTYIVVEVVDEEVLDEEVDEDVDELDDGGTYIVVEVVDEDVDVVEVEVEDGGTYIVVEVVDEDVDVVDVLVDVLVELEVVVDPGVVVVDVVGAGVPPNSKEPISPETPTGRGAPRWSYILPMNDATGSGPASIAIELDVNAIVFVGPPLSANA